MSDSAMVEEKGEGDEVKVGAEERENRSRRILDGGLLRTCCGLVPDCQRES